MKQFQTKGFVLWKSLTALTHLITAPITTTIALLGGGAFEGAL